MVYFLSMWLNQYAMASQIRYHKLVPKDALIQLRPRQGEDTFRTEDIIKRINEEGDEIAVVILSGIQYYTGTRK